MDETFWSRRSQARLPGCSASRGTPKCRWPLLKPPFLGKEAAAAPRLSTASPCPSPWAVLNTDPPGNTAQFTPSNDLPSSGVHRAVNLLSPELHNLLRSAQCLMNQGCPCVFIFAHSLIRRDPQSPTAWESALVSAAQERGHRGPAPLPRPATLRTWSGSSGKGAGIGAL